MWLLFSPPADLPDSALREMRRASFYILLRAENDYGIISKPFLPFNVKRDSIFKYTVYL